MAGRLYVIGIGPGDPELLTLKAVRILKAVACIFVPKGRELGSSLALSIVKEVVDLHGKEIVEAYFPMMKTSVPHIHKEGGGHDGSKDGDNMAIRRVQGLDEQWDGIAEAIVRRLGMGTDAAFITLGDPSIYSTYFYLHDRLVEKLPDLVVEIVPGVSSINAAAARAGISLGLGSRRIAVLPANYEDDLEKILTDFDTVVLMKANKVWGAIVETLRGMNLIERTIYVSRTGMDNERVIRDITQVRDEDLDYFSLVIIRK